MKVTVITQAYNTKNYIEKCISSVLNQTHHNLNYILIDNGCNDGSEEIIRKYAEQDNRIELIRFDKNKITVRWLELLTDLKFGDYVIFLDSDDWLEPDFIERMIKLAINTDSDIVSTGSFMHIEETNTIEQITLEKRLMLSKDDFAKAYPYYHVFFRVVWGKLISANIVKTTSLKILQERKVTYGYDTLTAFYWLRKANKICIDNSVLHHYRIHKKSVSHQYNPLQSYSDLYLYNDAINFLSPYGPVSENNLLFLHRVYANAITDTRRNIVSSTLTEAEKAEEYCKILERDVTFECYKRIDPPEDISGSKIGLFYEVFRSFSTLDEMPRKWNEIFIRYFPKCGAVVSLPFIKLAITEPKLFKGFINDDTQFIAEVICGYIKENKLVKQFPMSAFLCALNQNNPLLSDMTDTGFIKKYGEIYLMLYQKQYDNALEAMTDILLKEKVNNETFFTMYLNIAALLECVDEFIFGKIKLAGYYLSAKRFEECRSTLAEIADMGVEDNEEISSIKSMLGQ